MKIKSIRLKNFRSIGNSIEIDLPQICAFVGANNAGKSNILSALNKVLGKDWITVNNFNDEDVYQKNVESDIQIDIEFEEAFQYETYKGFEPSLIQSISFLYTRYKIGEFKGQRRLEKSCAGPNKKVVQVLSERPKAGAAHKYKPLSTIPQELQEQFQVIYIGTDRSLKNQLPSARNSLLATMLNDINVDFERQDNTIEVTSVGGEKKRVSRKERFQQCISEAIKALRTEEFTKLERSIKHNALHQLGFDVEREGDKLDLYFNPLTSEEFYKTLEIWVKENNYNINAINLGSGFQNAIVISVLKAFEERRKQGAIFLIEEPEMFLHPQMQRSLYKTIRKIGETNQVLYVTHSPNFVTIPEYDEIRITRKGENGTFTIESNLPATDKLKEKFRKELDPERNELFFAQRILIVEGDTEKLAFPEYAKRLGLDFDRVGSSIVEVGGKRNIMDFVDLALSFQIPVAFAYDKDSSDFNGKRDQEQEYNNTLNAYKDKGVEVFCFEKHFEQELSKFWGEKNYATYCQKYENLSKAIRGRFFAIDTEISIPDFVKPIIYWTANVKQPEVNG